MATTIVESYTNIRQIKYEVYSITRKLCRRKVVLNGAIVVRYNEHTRQTVELRFLQSAASKSFDMMYMKEVVLEKHRAEELVLFFFQHHTRIAIEADASTISKLFQAVINAQTVTPDKPPAMDIMSVTSSSPLRQHRLMSSSGYTPPLKRSNSLPQLSP
ncbi:hypothetical protein EON65_07175, partial [archaeon]